MPPTRTVSIDSQGMQIVELHRTESMPTPPVEFEKQLTDAQSNKEEDVFSYITSKVSPVISELKQLKIEVVMFMYMFSYIMRSVSSTSMILDKVCIVHLNESEYVCHHLKDHKDLKTTVEKIANNYHLGHSMLQMIPSAILACFIGAWSDKYGRKAPIVCALIGIIIDGLGSSICAGLFYTRVEYYFIPAIFTGLSGGFIGVFTVLYSYASDITTFRQRTMKYAIMELAFGLSMPLGILAGGFLFQAYGYFVVFMVSTVGHVLALAWVLFVLEETKGLDNTDPWREKFRNFWSFQPVLESYKATVKPRPNKGREQILLLMLAMGIAVLSFSSTANINYLYVHHMYDWDNTKYSTVHSIFSIIGVFCMFIAVPVFRRFGFDDPTLGLVGICSLLAKFITIGLAQRVGIYFLGNLFGLLGSLSTLAGRSRISKVSSKNDIGKIFAFLTSAEAILPIAAAAIVSQAFNATLDLYPGTTYLVLGCTMVIPLGIYIWMARLPAADYEEMYNNPQQEENEIKNEKKLRF
ncbi:proton-coupled folate transporter-like [Argiope bruennichi]|uniref:Proton-coupled folate transporter like protein n=1 Tax=Argiope bruennichi TaxID=94029 RepID=A0A8T0E0B1_ARGBR|nr:proton-coupled folate transporter-like [Argiope bruennichi]XP_055938634.1 proton-coupled folate transporter-like [Argiope bruennichi]KAF8764218.1 Proton-coupled folate transporter like protein [Argiope bruennichi]